MIRFLLLCAILVVGGIDATLIAQASIERAAHLQRIRVQQRFEHLAPVPEFSCGLNVDCSVMEDEETATKAAPPSCIERPGVRCA